MGFLLRCAAPGLLPVLPALRGPSPPARRPWRGSLITVTRDGSGGSGRDQRTGTSPILGRRSFPLASTLNRALAVNRMACRRVPYGTGTGAGRSAPSTCRRRRRRSSGTRRSGPPGPAGAPRQIPHRARPAAGWALAAVSRAGRRAPLGPAPAHRTPQPARPTGSRRRPHHRPERSAHWHLVRSRARRRRSGGPGSPRRCVPARPVLAAGGAPGRGSGCGGRSSP